MSVKKTSAQNMSYVLKFNAMNIIRRQNDLFWDWVSPYFGWTANVFIPEGYELIESESHKKERIEGSLSEKKASVSYLEKRVLELSKEIENEEKELLSLNSKNG